MVSDHLFLSVTKKIPNSDFIDTMSLRKKLKSKIQNFIDRLSGEHSQVAPEHITPYEKGTPDENVEVVMAKLERPGAAKTKQTTKTDTKVNSNHIQQERTENTKKEENKK